MYNDIYIFDKYFIFVNYFNLLANSKLKISLFLFLSTHIE